MLFEMEDFWESTYWSEHVPNDQLHEVLELVRTCASYYKEEIERHISPELLYRFRHEDWVVKTLREHNHLTITIEYKGA